MSESPSDSKRAQTMLERLKADDGGITYLSEMPHDIEDTIIKLILEIHRVQTFGNILVFAPGKGEISKIIRGVRNALDGKGYDLDQFGPLAIFELSANLSSDASELALNLAPDAYKETPNSYLLGRKLIVATNIAMRDSKVDDVAHVIDSCRIKRNIWNMEDETWSLQTLWITKALADERASRGNMAWRMVTEYYYETQFAEAPPVREGRDGKERDFSHEDGDMLRDCLKTMSQYSRPTVFSNAAADETVVKALGFLRQLGAVGDDGGVTPRGRAISSLPYPVDVYNATALLVSPEFRCSDAMLSLVALITVSNGGETVFISTANESERRKLEDARQKFQHPSGDHLTLLKVYTEWERVPERERRAWASRNMIQHQVLLSACERKDRMVDALYGHWSPQSQPHGTVDFERSILKAFAAGHFLHAAKRDQHAYQTIRHGSVVKLRRETKITPGKESDWVMYNKCFKTPDGTLLLNTASAIAPELLFSAAPEYWHNADHRLPGHIQNSIVKVLSKMSDLPESEILVAMPGRS